MLANCLACRPFSLIIMAISSKTLFHFTPKMEYLENILRDGFWPRYCREYGWGNRYVDFALPMVCFCDIPLSDIKEHASFYGAFGIGVTPAWIRSHPSITPVQYVALGSSEFNTVNALLTRLKRGEATIENIHKLSLVKKVSGQAIDKVEKRKRKKFYDEREWRCVPWGMNPMDIVLPINKKEAFDSETYSANTESYRLKVEPKDIKYILIPSERYRCKIINLLQDIYEDEKRDEIDVILSRIISVEQIYDDF